MNLCACWTFFIRAQRLFFTCAGKTEEESFKSSLLTEFVRDNTMYGGSLVTDIDLMLLAACKSGLVFLKKIFGKKTK